MPKIKDMATIRRAEKSSTLTTSSSTPGPPRTPRRLSGQTTADISRNVWFRAHQYCVKHNMPTEEHDGVIYLLADRPLAFFIKAEVPQLEEYEGGRQHIYDLLRQTTNAVNKGTVAFPKWLIRDDWHEGAAIMLFRGRRSNGPDRIDEVAARLTPQEAGELRDPEPVYTSMLSSAWPLPEETPNTPTQEPVPQEDDMTTIEHPAPHGPLSGNALNDRFEAFAERVGPEAFICPTCNAKFDTVRGRVGHQSAHTKRRKKAEVQAARQAGPGGVPLPPGVKVITGVGKLNEGEHYSTLPNGSFECLICHATFATRTSLGPHYKTHTFERRAAQLASMAAEIARLKADRKNKVSNVDMDPERALQVLTEVVTNSGSVAELITANEEALGRLGRAVAENENLVAENHQLRAVINDLGNRTLAHGALNGDLETVLDMLEGVLTKVQAGTYPVMRALADVDDIVHTARGKKTT